MISLKGIEISHIGDSDSSVLETKDKPQAAASP
jgi:hypothetical protein